MPTYIIRPGQHVTHGTQEAAQEHRARHAGMTGPIMNPLLLPPVPLGEFEEGDEIELTEEQAAAMPWAVSTPEEYEAESSPSALMKKGYPKDEAESMVALRKAALDARKARRGKAAPAPRLATPFGMQPTDGSTEPNPRNAARFPDEGHKRTPQK